MSKVLKLERKNEKTGKLQSTGRMEIKNKSNDFAELYFYGDIVSSSWDKWEDEDRCPQDVVDFLNELNGVKNIDIHINSGGGSVFAGLAIYNVLKRHSAYKTVYVDGLAASIASVIALAGDRVIIPKTAQFMVHKPMLGICAFVNAIDFRKMADDLDEIEVTLMNVYEENLRDGVDIETIREFVQAETWMSGEVASQYFNIETSEGLDVVACTSDYFNQYKNTPKTFMKKSHISDTNTVADNAITTTSNKKQKIKLELDLI